ncbi:MAG: hydroxymethylglutaryl-CoA lyase [Lautropia sp.]|nr:hydroxymethylglutaryl-CoA lyase [Lautropia sp.]MCL4702058.1 hydroxymethylglutaryl-CoA lyase [Burkholderiaceae bacterium]MDL1908464.1 hydroxymethylglutaryl-CoA lyase [Betaproteobacteria bacterium PRO1]RIK88288.1 MAG: hydroxymethylglutaryl-CoA lyase [Burkholderiales bacterium]
MKLPSRVLITEVGPRDGLQNEKQPVSTDAKVELCTRLLQAGVRQLEATSFVSPKWVPQMADAAEVMARLPRPDGVAVSVLTPNMKGFEAALAAGADEVVIFAAASEAFSMRNINCSIAESIERFRPVAQAAIQHRLRLRAALSVAFGCPYEGEVPVAAVVDVASRLRDLGCDEIGIADTIGVGTAAQVERVFDAVAREVPLDRLSGHFHDTYGQAIANVVASLQAGVFRFDSSIAGLGGCPYAKGATGNVATEDVVYLMHGLGIETGLDLDALVDTGQWISRELGRASASRAGNAIAARRRAQAGAAA